MAEDTIQDQQGAQGSMGPHRENSNPEGSGEFAQLTFIVDGESMTRDQWRAHRERAAAIAQEVTEFDAHEDAIRQNA